MIPVLRVGLCGRGEGKDNRKGTKEGQSDPFRLRYEHDDGREKVCVVSFLDLNGLCGVVCGGVRQKES